MTNEEINLAIATIQGFTYVPPEMGRFGKMTYPKWRHSSGGEYVSETPPPYATSWQWCGPLIAKYSLSVLCAEGWTAANAFCGKSGETPQRAICLAVIAAQPTPATLPPEAPIHDNDRS